LQYLSLHLKEQWLPYDYLTKLDPALSARNASTSACTN